MAQSPFRLTLVALGTLAIGGGLWFVTHSFSSEPAASTPTAGLQTASPSVPGTATVPPPTVDRAAAQAVLNSPAAQAYQTRLQFAADYRRFIQDAARLSDEERQRQAEALAKEVERREAATELALSEALLLQLGLAQAQGGDEAEQKARAEQLLARYQALSRQRETLAKAPDARFSQYKSEEKRIVDEVLTLQTIPDGLSRDQYLRQRLQEAREQAYR